MHNKEELVLEELINTWYGFSQELGTRIYYCLGEDSKAINAIDQISNRDYNTYIEKYLSKDLKKHKSKLHLGLIPQPFSGNLKTASVFILMLNPGVLPSDYYAEENSKEYRDELIKTLKQEFTEDDEYPFFWFNPKFLWTGGGNYWFNKLKSHLETFCKQNNKTMLDALKYFSKKIAVIQLFPYHSEKTPPFNADKLLSTKLAYNFVNENLIPKVKRGEAGVIVARRAKSWGGDSLKGINNIAVYEGSHRIGAHMGVGTTGGNLIHNFITKKYSGR